MEASTTAAPITDTGSGLASTGAGLDDVKRLSAGRDADTGSPSVAAGAGGAAGNALAEATIEAPHFGQKRASTLQGLPQLAQVPAAIGASVVMDDSGSTDSCSNMVPHRAQDRAPLLFSAWQSVQFTGNHFQLGYRCRGRQMLSAVKDRAPRCNLSPVAASGSKPCGLLDQTQLADRE